MKTDKRRVVVNMTMHKAQGKYGYLRNSVNLLHRVILSSHFILLLNTAVGWDSSVDIATRYGLDDPGMDSR